MTCDVTEVGLDAAQIDDRGAGLIADLAAGLTVDLAADLSGDLDAGQIHGLGASLNDARRMVFVSPP